VGGGGAGDGLTHAGCAATLRISQPSPTMPQSLTYTWQTDDAAADTHLATAKSPSATCPGCAAAVLFESNPG